jgi:ATP-dependent exoDNAse (exonuclease V) beta subunit
VGAFNARPLGMPIPPNWFGLAAFALLGAFVSPGFLVLGAGAELAYLLAMSRSRRFRNTVDAAALADDPADQRYQALLGALSQAQVKRQQALEDKAREIMGTLGSSPLMASHAGVAGAAGLAASAPARRAPGARPGGRDGTAASSAQLEQQEAQIDARLADPGIGAELRRSLEQQKSVIDARQAAHAQAGRRMEHVDAELQRIEQQIALIREQALLATDEEQIGSSLDALTASFNEANRWLDSQRDLLGALDFNDTQRLPARVLRAGQAQRRSEGESACQGNRIRAGSAATPPASSSPPCWCSACWRWAAGW